MGISTKIFHSSKQDIPWDDWESVRRQAKGGMIIGMEPGFLTSIEHSMVETSKLWYVIFYSENNTPVAAACLSTLRVDMGVVAGAGVQRTVEKLRKLIPSLLNMNIMFCGIPVSLGEKSLLFTEQANPDEILNELDKLVTDLARQQKASFIAYKEHTDDERIKLKTLPKLGYRLADSIDMHTFEEPFENFEQYLSNLNSHYRYDVRRSLRKLERADVEVVRWTDPDEICRQYTEELHQLYYAVVDQSENKFEILPREFFHELARTFPNELALTALVKDSNVLAFNWSLNTHSSYHFLFCGIDYKFNNKMDLYFNLMYAELGHALQSGASEIMVGQTAPTFKLRLGCRQLPLHLYIKGAGIFTNMLLKLAFGLLFPARKAMEMTDIYNSKYKASQGLGQNQA